MDSVGAYEAKTNLSKLLERVAGGERIVITRHGVPVAVLSPPDGAPALGAAEAVVRLREFREGRCLGDLSLREMIEEGRR
ncbi:MAG: type II toxin-antitoxin system Phd/YefM family antitoxin [Deltaproteobacteria bacterium]|jgi:prevent-host-death family protein|nr:type II toxin-antitoxin system Phd/YefM family antitoxin [Deltaproteobacteria bacterium]